LDTDRTYCLKNKIKCYNRIVVPNDYTGTDIVTDEMVIVPCDTTVDRTINDTSSSSSSRRRRRGFDIATIDCEDLDQVQSLVFNIGTSDSSSSTTTTTTTSASSLHRYHRYEFTAQDLFLPIDTNDGPLCVLRVTSSTGGVTNTGSGWILGDILF
jgi:hypothetical protein